ncbi:MAG: NAD(P)/FAD-dependent oxidoreductase [Saprospiraceae bacterium]|nr:NAD(P)/FAD-dependent oxidoreductase [Saprospiraceae bacterium]
MVVIIGAGVAGLTCAKYLKNQGIEALILESSDGIGGRVRTDTVEGFTLDRGFQVMLTSYPEAIKLLDFNALNLKTLPSGARIREGNRFITMPNPLKNLLTAPQALYAPIGNFLDKLKILTLNLSVLNATDPSVKMSQKPESTLSFLKTYGYSDTIIERFFRPFFRGVFLEKNLETEASFFKFLFHHFSKGDVVVPEKGMQAIPEQIAGQLAQHQIRLNTPVEKIVGKTVFLKNGQIIEAEKIVVATDANTAARLLGEIPNTKFNQTTCLYFTSDTPISISNKKTTESYLCVNANAGELIAHVLVMSDFAPTYAPIGKRLISVSLVGKNTLSDTELIEKTKAELPNWFEGNHNFQHLKTYHIPEALPQFFTTPPQYKDLKINDFTYRCGDYAAYPSLNAAMKTGREVAEMIGIDINI